MKDRMVESSSAEPVITDRGEPVLKIVPFAHDPEEALRSLRGTVVHFEDPLEPVDMEDWEVLDTHARVRGDQFPWALPGSAGASPARRAEQDGDAAARALGRPLSLE